MKLTIGFWIALVVMIILFFMPTVLTYNAPAYDGERVYGFPLPYYSWGGFCFSPDGGQMCRFVSYPFMIIDLLILVGIPLGVNLILLRLKN